VPALLAHLVLHAVSEVNVMTMLPNTLVRLVIIAQITHRKYFVLQDTTAQQTHSLLLSVLSDTTPTIKVNHHAQNALLATIVVMMIFRLLRELVYSQHSLFLVNQANTALKDHI
jgi:hypothetical protein